MRLDLLSTFLISGGFILLLCVGAANAYDPEFDYNEDGVVDEIDLEILNLHFNAAEGDDLYDPAFDHDADGYIGGTDYVAAMRAAAE